MPDVPFWASATSLEDGRALVIARDSASAQATLLFEPLGLGAECESSADCASGFCREGVCCDEICNDGLCSTCLKFLGAVQEGICTPLHTCDRYACRPETGGCADPCEDAEDCAPEHFCVEGACLPRGPDGKACDAAFECASGFCTEGICCNEACDEGLCKEACSTRNRAPADGTCVAVNPPCAPFVCEPSSGACLTRCTSLHDCDPGLVCTPYGACVPPPPSVSFLDRTSCSVSSVSTPSSPASSRVPAAPALLLAAAAALLRGRRRRAREHRLIS